MNLFSLMQKLVREIRQKTFPKKISQKPENLAVVQEKQNEPRELKAIIPVRMKKIPFSSVRETNDFFQKYPELLYRLALKKMPKAFSTHAPVIYLFRIGETNTYTKIHEDDYMKMLYKMEEVFKKKELYEELEKTLELQRLLTEQYVDQLIEDSKQT